MNIHAKKWRSWQIRQPWLRTEWLTRVGARAAIASKKRQDSKLWLACLHLVMIHLGLQNCLTKNSLVIHSFLGVVWFGMAEGLPYSVLWRSYFYIIVHYQLLRSHTSFSIFRQMLIEGAGRRAGSTSAATWCDSCCDTWWRPGCGAGRGGGRSRRRRRGRSTSSSSSRVTARRKKRWRHKLIAL